MILKKEKCSAEIAADQGYADSQYNLGAIYANGIGNEKDPRKAIQWWTLAANQGDIEAKNALEQNMGQPQ
jgi:TPR repeat protein